MRTAHTGAAPAAEGAPLLRTWTPGAETQAPPTSFALPALASGPRLKPTGPSRATDSPCRRPEPRGPRGHNRPPESPDHLHLGCLVTRSIPLQSPGNSPGEGSGPIPSPQRKPRRKGRQRRDHGSAGWGFRGLEEAPGDLRAVSVLRKGNRTVRWEREPQELLKGP